MTGCTSMNDTPILDAKDPTMYFGKIIADFRSVLEHPTIRGITHSGDIVNFEFENKDKDNFWVEYGLDGGRSYYENYRIMGHFNDQRYSDAWADHVQHLINEYEHHLNSYG